MLSGTSTVEQTLDNIKIFSDAKANGMTEEELEIVAKARELYRKRIAVDCTGCAYCMPCPMGVDIPKIFAKWNNSYKYDTKDYGYKKLVEDGNGPDKCVSCGKCMKVCPQHIDIPGKLAQAKEYFEN